MNTGMHSSLNTCILLALYLKYILGQESQSNSLLELSLSLLGRTCGLPSSLAHACAGELSDFINSDLMKTDASRARDMR